MPYNLKKYPILFWHLLEKVITKWKIFSTFLAFSGYINFKYLQINNIEKQMISLKLFIEHPYLYVPQRILWVDRASIGRVTIGSGLLPLHIGGGRHGTDIWARYDAMPTEIAFDHFVRIFECVNALVLDTCKRSTPKQKLIISAFHIRLQPVRNLFGMTKAML